MAAFKDFLSNLRVDVSPAPELLTNYYNSSNDDNMKNVIKSYFNYPEIKLPNEKEEEELITIKDYALQIYEELKKNNYDIFNNSSIQNSVNKQQYSQDSQTTIESNTSSEHSSFDKSTNLE